MKTNIYTKLYTPEKQLQLAGNPRIKRMADICRDFRLTRKKILDIGCYDGTFLSSIQGEENELYGVDASEYGCVQAHAKGIRVVKYFFDDISPVPFTDGLFDVVTAGEIIEHVYDTDFFLAEVARLLKPGGLFLVSTPNIASLGRRILLLLGISPIIENSPHEQDSSGHIRYFTFATLTRLLQKHRFAVISSVSDVINFSSSGRLRSTLAARVFPSLGQSVICVCKRSPL